MHIFLTGGTGFIGSNFIKLALSKSHNIKAIKRSEKSNSRIILKSQPYWLNKKFSQIDTIIELIFSYSESNRKHGTANKVYLHSL